MRKHFRPELLNRLDEIVIFDPLLDEQLRKVARIQKNDIVAIFAKKGIVLDISDAALDVVLSESYDPVSIFHNVSSSCQMPPTRTPCSIFSPVENLGFES